MPCALHLEPPGSAKALNSDLAKGPGCRDCDERIGQKVIALHNPQRPFYDRTKNRFYQSHSHSFSSVLSRQVLLLRVHQQ